MAATDDAVKTMTDIGGLEFFARLLEALAWPLAVIILVWILREPFGSLLREVRKIRYKGAEIELGAAVEEAVEAAREAGVTVSYPENAFPPDALQQATVQPAFAIVESWAHIEEAIRNWGIENMPNGSESGRTWRSTQLIRELRNRDVIDVSLFELLHLIRGIRNRAVHSPSRALSEEVALHWLSISKSVKDRLDQKLSGQIG